VIGTYVPDIGIDGAVRGYYGLTNDLTDLKRSQELLRSSEERLGLLMETFTDYAIISLDRDGRVDSWNTGAEHIFGYSRDEMLGRTCDRLFTPEDVADGVPLKEMRGARQRGRASDERWHVRKDGSRFFASGVMVPLYVGKALSGYAKIASDLTEKHRQAEELQKAHDQLESRVAVRTRELASTNAALLAEIEQRAAAEKQRIELLRRLVTSQEVERRRIARDLHDQLGQRLTALRLKIASLKEVSLGSRFAPLVERLQEIGEQLDTEVSFLAWELRPSALDDLGLIDAVGAYVDEWSRHYETPAEFHASGVTNDQFDREAETHLYRITQEALNNISKYAAATEVSVLMEKMGDNIVVIIEDNGRGFDPSAETARTEAGHGLGLTGMRERAALIGGDLEIESAAGKGTTIYIRVPAAK
jgi:PAS domain S-box-containing protein